jgi:hypothetical protein
VGTAWVRNGVPTDSEGPRLTRYVQAPGHPPDGLNKPDSALSAEGGRDSNPRHAELTCNGFRDTAPVVAIPLCRAVCVSSEGSWVPVCGPVCVIGHGSNISDAHSRVAGAKQGPDRLPLRRTDCRASGFSGLTQGLPLSRESGSAASAQAVHLSGRISMLGSASVRYGSVSG